MAGKNNREPSFGSVVNRAFQRSLGTSTQGHQIPESNRKINDWMRAAKDQGSNTRARAAAAREDLFGGGDS